MIKKFVFTILAICIFLSAAPGIQAQGKLYDDLPKVKITDGVQKDYYNSGKLKMSSEVTGGKRHGITKVYDTKGKLKIQYRFHRGNFVKAFLQEPKRDYGPFAIFLTFKFWAIVLIVGAALWFIAIKVLFKGRPF